MISERTKAALAAAQRRGVQLGGYNKNPKLTAQARKAGQEANARVAAGPVITELQAAGATSLRAIAAGLNDRASLLHAGPGLGLPRRSCACWRGADGFGAEHQPLITDALRCHWTSPRTGSPDWEHWQRPAGTE
jgi:hypothetical protein